MAFLLISALDVAAAAALDLQLHAPADCPSQAELEGRVLELVSEKGRTDRELRARIEITRAGAGPFRLALRVVVGKQELSRVVEASACRSVCDTAAWLIAMAAAEPARERGPRAPPSAPAAVGHTPRPRPRSEAVAAAAAVNPAHATTRSDDAKSERSRDADADGADGADHHSVASPAMASSATAADGDAVAAVHAAEASAPQAPSPASSAAVARVGPSASASAAAAPPAKDAGGERRARHFAASLRPRWGRVSAVVGYFDAGLPHGAATFGILAGYGRGPFYIQLRGSWALPAADALPGSGTLTVRTGQLSLAGCLVWGERWRGGPCLELRGARSVIDVADVSEPAEQSVWWLSGGPSGQLGVRVLRRWELLVEAGLGLPLTGRPRVGVEGRGEVLQAGFVSGFANFGMGARWP